ncbi:AraC family transcriptional regulator [Chitinophaga silvatica]|uniref:AraC family transcriptional regulator n=1 Tax=Chitinophaga silvatica TaxID=2282649 RepID=A0A3E1Y5V4_9BACT|nr:helix-turn-helix transcriptional regulator [Chitinophaga silvatica]RFS20092.1 AraC family transcriptional regulator [Chitinophaga silvatica]
MKKTDNSPYRINSISQLFRMLHLPEPLHPLVGLVRNKDVKNVKEEFPEVVLLDFYKISYKPNLSGKVKYGQGYYDFDEGGMVFISPNQLVTAPDDDESEGISLFVHPDFLQPYPLANLIKKYYFFSYATNEALHLSAKEKVTILSIFESIDDELKQRIDDFSQDVIVTQINLLLNYSNRFYKRQFITRKAVNTDLLIRLETLLDNYFDKEAPLLKGIPTVQYLAEQLYVSPHYLSDMLRSTTGLNAQQHIHNKIIEKAKEILSTSTSSVAQVAYTLGFEHPQSFHKFFKTKTGVSPLKYRQSFN